MGCSCLRSLPQGPPSLSSIQGIPGMPPPLPPFLSPCLPPNLGGKGRRIRLAGAGEWRRGAGQGTRGKGGGAPPPNLCRGHGSDGRVRWKGQTWITDQTVQGSSQARPDWDKIPRCWQGWGGVGGEMSLVTLEKLALNTGQDGSSWSFGESFPWPLLRQGWGSVVRHRGRLRLQVGLGVIGQTG